MEQTRRPLLRHPLQSPAVVATTAAPAPASTPAAPVTTAAPVSTGQKQTIKISGSTTVLPIVQKAADQYMATHPDADIQISGGGSGVGIQAIGAKTVDIGMSSREVTKDEMAKNPGFVITPVAQDGIAIIVNPANTIQYITLDQVKEHLSRVRSPSGPRLPEQTFPAPTTRLSSSAATAHPVPAPISMRPFSGQQPPPTRCSRRTPTVQSPRP